jgi:hypothetical protein
MLETIITIVVALALLGTILWAAEKYLVVPAPFAWAKGLLMFVLVVLACYFVWDTLTGHHVVRGRVGATPTASLAAAA